MIDKLIAYVEARISALRDIETSTPNVEKRRDARIVELNLVLTTMHQLKQNKTFIVGYTDLYCHELTLERIEAATWQDAVCQHSKYPYQGTEGGDNDYVSPDELSKRYPDLEPEQSFRQCCFDCDSMMNWVEI